MKYDVINNVKMFLQYIAGYTVANFGRYPIRSRVTKGNALEYIVYAINSICGLVYGIRNTSGCLQS